MKNPKFNEMTPEQFKAFQPTEAQITAYDWEENFRTWCEERNEDYTDDNVRDSYTEANGEIENFWKNLSEPDREGYEGMMTND